MAIFEKLSWRLISSPYLFSISLEPCSARSVSLSPGHYTQQHTTTHSNTQQHTAAHSSTQHPIKCRTTNSQVRHHSPWRASHLGDVTPGSSSFTASYNCVPHGFRPPQGCTCGHSVLTPLFAALDQFIGCASLHRGLRARVASASASGSH